jgi:hypothetical protein
LLPSFVRKVSLLYLFSTVKRRYGRDHQNAAVQLLPFGLYAKRCDRSHGNESNALRLLGTQSTSIPASLYIDSFKDSDRVEWFIMTRLPSIPLKEVFHRLSYPERDQLVHDLQRVLKEMHLIKNTSPYIFSNTTGGPTFDRRLIPNSIAGPYTQRGRSQHVHCPRPHVPNTQVQTQCLF